MQASEIRHFSATTNIDLGGCNHMFARTVTVRLKSNAVADFSRTLENEIVPILRKQKGFQDELTLVAPDGNEAVGISLWDNKQNAEAYQRETFAEVQRILSKSIEGNPQVKTYEVPYSTLHKAARSGGGA
jgi:heme-degrading monooxygenase HmoA